MYRSPVHRLMLHFLPFSETLSFVRVERTSFHARVCVCACVCKCFTLPLTINVVSISLLCNNPVSGINELATAPPNDLSTPGWKGITLSWRLHSAWAELNFYFTVTFFIFYETALVFVHVRVFFNCPFAREISKFWYTSQRFQLICEKSRWMKCLTYQPSKLETMSLQYFALHAEDLPVCAPF